MTFPPECRSSFNTGELFGFIYGVMLMLSIAFWVYMLDDAQRQVREEEANPS